MILNSPALFPENRDAANNPRIDRTQKITSFHKYRVDLQKMLINNDIKIDSDHALPMNKIDIPEKSSSSDQKIIQSNEQAGPFKISTSIARQALLGIMTPKDEYHFLRNFQSFKNTKVYFFIILAHAKILLPLNSLQNFKASFARKINNKIYYYRKEIEKTKNDNFRKLRLREIDDIENALAACRLYLNGNIEEALSMFYKKEKSVFRTTKQYCQNLETIINVEEVLAKQTCNNYTPNSLAFSHLDKKIPPHLPKQIIHSERTYPFLNHANEFKEQKLRDDIWLKWPLLYLEDSFPIYDHFFPTIFDYGMDYMVKINFGNWNLQLKPLNCDEQRILPTQNHINQQPRQI